MSRNILGQTKLESLIEVIGGRLISYALAFIGQVILFNIILDLGFTVYQNLGITTYFFLISFIFNYIWRRYWNQKLEKRWHDWDNDTGC